MFKNKSITTWRLALIILMLLVIAGSLVIAYQTGTFTHKGPKLNILGRKEYVNPGKLLYSENGYNGIWSLYQKTSETVLTYTNNDGIRQWQRIYDTSRLLTHSHTAYSITGNLGEPNVNVINALGDTVWSWQAPGKLLLCRTNDQGQTFVYHELNNDKSQSTWTNRMTLFNNRGQEVWHSDLRNTEILDFLWLQNNFATLTYTVTPEEQRQTLTVYSGQGDILWQDTIDTMITHMATNRIGDTLIWLTAEKATLLQVPTEQTKEIAIADAITCGFATPDTLFFIFDQTGWPGLKGNSKLLYTDLTGKTIDKKRYSGHFTDYTTLPDGTLIMSTNKGVYGTLPHQALWHVPFEKDVIQIAVDISDNALFVFTNDDTLNWYQILP